MTSTSYSSVAEANFQRNPNQIFTRRRDAHDNGYFAKWELERRGKKPNGPSSAILVDACEATDHEKEIIRGWDFVIWLDDDTIGRNQKKLWHISETKPYRPTEKTQALWSYRDTFVPQWKTWAAELSSDWEIMETESYAYGLNHSRVNQHISGQDTFGFVEGKYTNFVACRLQYKNCISVLEKAPDIQKQLCASKWFCEIDPEGVNVFFIFEGRRKTIATTHLRTALSEIGVDVPVYPNKNGFRLPLARGTTCILDRPLQLVTRRGRTEQDVVGLMEWIQDPDAENMAMAEIVELLQAKVVSDMPTAKPSDIIEGLRRTEDENTKIQPYNNHYYGSITTMAQNDDELHGELKNRCWKTLTSFWLGQAELAINTAIGITVRIFAVEGVNKDEAVTIIDNWCDELPNPTTSRLTDPHKRHLLTKYIRRQVRRLYNGNGGQEHAELSTKKLQLSVRCWSSKGLILHDKSTWNLTYGYMSVPDVEFTEQERKNIEVYLGPLLSTRDIKNWTREEVSVKLAEAVVKLVATKEREGLAIANPYWQKYIKGEVGVNCQNKVKFQKIKEALLQLGLMKVIWQGRQGYGATRYGLVGRLAELMAPEGIEASNLESYELPDNVDEQIAEIVTPYDTDAITTMVLLSIAVQNENTPVIAPQLNNDWHSTGDPILDKLLAENPRNPNNEQAEERRFALW
jgi:hypothetical protein